jgi:hypothetical protein
MAGFYECPKLQELLICECQHVGLDDSLEVNQLHGSKYRLAL